MTDDNTAAAATTTTNMTDGAATTTTTNNNMDLAHADDVCASLPHVTALLNQVKQLDKLINQAKDNNAGGRSLVDYQLYNTARETKYTAQGAGGAKEDKPIAFPHLLAAFEAAVEQVATPAQKKKRDDSTYKQFNYSVTHFLHDMMTCKKHERRDYHRALKLALQADTTAIIATARRIATDILPNLLFEGAPLLLPSTSSTTTTDEARKAIEALYAEAQEQQCAIARRIENLECAEEPLKLIDGYLLALRAFEADGSLMPPDAAEEERDAKRAKH